MSAVYREEEEEPDESDEESEPEDEDEEWIPPTEETLKKGGVSDEESEEEEEVNEDEEWIPPAKEMLTEKSVSDEESEEEDEDWTPPTNNKFGKRSVSVKKIICVERRKFKTKITERRKKMRPPPAIIPIPMKAPPSVQCPHCSKAFPHDRGFRLHLRSIHPLKCCKCPLCEEILLSPQELSQHYNQSHKKPENVQLTPVSRPVIIKKKKKPEFPFICMCCPPSITEFEGDFKTREDLFDHVKKKHSWFYWPCEHCNLLKYKEKSLQRHLENCSKKNNPTDLAPLSLPSLISNLSTPTPGANNNVPPSLASPPPAPSLDIQGASYDEPLSPASPASIPDGQDVSDDEPMSPRLTTSNLGTLGAPANDTKVEVKAEPVQPSVKMKTRRCIRQRGNDKCEVTDGDSIEYKSRLRAGLRPRTIKVQSSSSDSSEDEQPEEETEEWKPHNDNRSSDEGPSTRPTKTNSKSKDSQSRNPTSTKPKRDRTKKKVSQSKSPEKRPVTVKKDEKTSEEAWVYCELCGKKIANHHTSLKYHMATIHQIGDFPCTIEGCSKVFGCQSRLDTHIRAHKGICPFKCNQCEKSYVTRSILNMHIKNVHTLKETGEVFPCYKCGKDFRLEQHLKQHLKIHEPKEGKERLYKKKIWKPRGIKEGEPERPFICEQCGKGFPTQPILNTHVLALHINKESKPFQCEECGRGFAILGYLKLHKRFHRKRKTGEVCRPFECKECGKKFISQRNLDLHFEARHSENRVTKPFKCEKCGKGFATKDYARQHLRKRH